MLSAGSLATPKIEKHEDPAPPQLLQLEGRIVPAVPFSPAFPNALSITTGSGVVSNSASFTVIFNQPVIGVDATDFNLIPTGTVANGTIASITGSGDTYTVNVTGITGSGTLGLNLANLPSITALPSFASAVPFLTQPTAASVTLGDVNRDGILDIVTANGASNNASVLLGVGDGNFGGIVNYTVGTNPRSVTLGDVNGDGNLDIITANANSNNISVLIGIGNGTFGTAVPYATGSAPTNSAPASVTLGDVNGDGKLDIITALSGNASAGVLLGNGDGTFASINYFATGIQPVDATLGDVNGDGKLDIITANRTSVPVSSSVLLGHGDGTFVTAVNYETGSGVFSVTLGDVNRDGILDIITANRSSNNVSVLLGIGDGTFGPKTDYAALSNGATSVKLGDVNGDGILDIITANFNSNNASVLLGNGNGTFGLKTGFTTGIQPNSVTLGDVNGDGRLDIITANISGGSASVLLGTGGSAITATFSPQQTLSTGLGPFSVTLGDVNRDGILDIVTVNNISANTSVFLGIGDGTFGGKVDYPTGSNPSSVTLGDVNRDGILDIITANGGISNTASVLLGNPNGTFQTNVDFVVGTNPSSVTLGDVNGDGILDIITANGGSNNASVLLGIGNGNFGAKVDYATGTLPNSVTLRDVNGDGKLDIITSNGGMNTNSASVLLGIGNGTFGLNVDYAAGTRPNSVTLGDVNGDGKLDIITANFGSNNASVLLGNGNGTFKTQVTFAAMGTGPVSVTLGDVNGDGRLDISTANIISNNVSVLLNNINFTGQTATVSDGAAPTVASISPTSGSTAGGTSITITGANLTGATAVTIDGVAATNVTVVSSTSITATTPAGTAGANKSVLVTTPGGTNTGNTLFTYTAAAPTVASISPTSGSTAGGTSITITGANLTGATAVTIDGVAATNVTVVSSTSITATTPAGTAGANKSVLVTTPGGTNTGNTLFTYTAAPTPPAPSPTPTPTPPAPTPTPTPTPTAPLVVGTPPPPSSGGSSTVTLYNTATGEPTGTAVPFPGFNGPVKVVSGDFDGDGVAELIAGAGFGGGPAIAILNSQTGEVMESFFAFDPAFTGGVFVAVQDTNGDGILDIIASAGPGGGPEVRIFDGASLNVLRAFYAYDQSFTGGVSVASIDFNNDGILDLVTGAGPGGGPHVKVFDGATNAIISQWYAYPASFTGGVFVAVGDIGNDGNFEVVTGAGQGGTPVVAVWDPFTGALLAQFMAYAEDFTGGVRVAVNDGNGDGVPDIITGAGPGGGPQVNVFNFPALDLLFSFYSGDPANTGGVFVS